MDKNKQVISPIPGIFYRKPSPDEKEYVSEGQIIKPGDIIGLVEVMKSFYELKSDVEGVIVRFNVENEELIDVGQIIVELE